MRWRRSAQIDSRFIVGGSGGIRGSDAKGLDGTDVV